MKDISWLPHESWNTPDGDRIDRMAYAFWAAFRKSDAVKATEMIEQMRPAHDFGFRGKHAPDYEAVWRDKLLDVIAWTINGINKEYAEVWRKAVKRGIYEDDEINAIPEAAALIEESAMYTEVWKRLRLWLDTDGSMSSLVVGDDG